MDSFEPAPSVTWEPGGHVTQDFCHHCGGALDAGAVVCPHCNQMLMDHDQADELLADQSRHAHSPQVVLALVAVAVALALVGVGVVVAIWPLLRAIFQ